MIRAYDWGGHWPVRGVKKGKKNWCSLSEPVGPWVY